MPVIELVDLSTRTLDGGGDLLLGDEDALDMGAVFGGRRMFFHGIKI